MRGTNCCLMSAECMDLLTLPTRCFYNRLYDNVLWKMGVGRVQLLLHFADILADPQVPLNVNEGSTITLQDIPDMREGSIFLCSCEASTHPGSETHRALIFKNLN